MSRKLLLLIFLVFLGQVLLVLPIKLSFGQSPSAATVGRYVVSEDKYWIIYNKTVQELKN